jgi:hypothetical protein
MEKTVWEEKRKTWEHIELIQGSGSIGKSDEKFLRSDEK